MIFTGYRPPFASFFFSFFFLCQDKRREVGARTHAAAKAREDAADGLDMKESDTMGGGDSFRDALARTKHGQKRRQMAKTVRVYTSTSIVSYEMRVCVFFVCVCVCVLCLCLCLWTFASINSVFVCFSCCFGTNELFLT